MLYPIGISSLVDAPTQYTSIRSCPINFRSIFIAVGPQAISLWSFWPFCLLSHCEWKAEDNFVDCNEGGYRGVHEWNEANWRQIDLIGFNGNIDRFLIIDTIASILPATTATIVGLDKLHLSTPKLGLVYHGRVDSAGRNISDPQTSPISISSKLFRTKDGLLGQITSDGFFLLELRLPDQRFIDLRHSKLILLISNPEELHRKTSLDHENGYLAIIAENRVVIYDLFKQGSPVIANLAYDAGLDDILWLSDSEIAVVEGKQIVLTNICTDERFSINLEQTSRGLVACHSRSSLICLSKDHPNAPSMFRIALASKIETSGNTSRFAIFKKEGQLLRFRISPHVFSSQTHTVEIRDHSMIWETIDVPFDSYLAGSLRGPIWLTATDSLGNWIAIAGKSGFCLCNLPHRKWKLFANPQEESSFIVKEFTWISLANDRNDPVHPVLAAHVFFSASQQYEFLVFVPEDELSLAKVAYRQSVERKIVAIHDCSQGILGILLDDGDIQLIELNVGRGKLSISLLLRASLASILTNLDLNRPAVKFTFIRKHFLLLVKNNDSLLSVAIPSENHDNSIKEIAATLIFRGHIDDYLLWSMGDDHIWLIIESKGQFRFKRAPFTNQGTDFEVSAAGRLGAFYPTIAFGLAVYFEASIFSLGCNEAPLYRINVNQTEALIVHILFYLITLEDEKETLYKLCVHLEKNDELLLILEMLLTNILNQLPESSQNSIYRRFKTVFMELLPNPNYCKAIHNFLRRIEINDATRILDLLGPFKDLFQISINHNELLAAWSFLRIASFDHDSNSSSHQLERFGDLLKRSFYLRHDQVFKGTLQLSKELEIELSPLIEEIKNEVLHKRDWGFLEILYSEGFAKDISIDRVPIKTIIANTMLHSSLSTLIVESCLIIWIDTEQLLQLLTTPGTETFPKKESHVVAMLRKLNAEDEAAMWAYFVDGNPAELTRLSPSDAPPMQTDELATIIRTKYDLS